jgi:hypothetical protein
MQRRLAATVSEHLRLLGRPDGVRVQGQVRFDRCTGSSSHWCPLSHVDGRTETDDHTQTPHCELNGSGHGRDLADTYGQGSRDGILKGYSIADICSVRCTHPGRISEAEQGHQGQDRGTSGHRWGQAKTPKRTPNRITSVPRGHHRRDEGAASENGEIVAIATATSLLGNHRCMRTRTRAGERGRVAGCKTRRQARMSGMKRRGTRMPGGS